MTTDPNNLLTVIGAFLAFGTALLGYLKSRQNGDKLSDIHTQTNGNLTSEKLRSAQLERYIEINGLPIPPTRVVGHTDPPSDSGEWPPSNVKD